MLALELLVSSSVASSGAIEREIRREAGIFEQSVFSANWRDFIQSDASG